MRPRLIINFPPSFALLYHLDFWGVSEKNQVKKIALFHSVQATPSLSNSTSSYLVRSRHVRDIGTVKAAQAHQQSAEHLRLRKNPTRAPAKAVSCSCILRLIVCFVYRLCKWLGVWVLLLGALHYCFCFWVFLFPFYNGAKSDAEPWAGS